MTAVWWRQGDRRGLGAALALYRTSFERSRIPDERVLALLENGIYRLALDGAGLRAMALVARFPEERFAHLDYIATAVPERRQGIATALVRWLVDQTRADGMDALTLETEDPRFYGARGACKLAGLPYMFPSPALGPMPMHVMAFALQGQTDLTRARAAQIVRALYRVIHARGEPDPVLDSILERIPERVPLISSC